MLFLFAVLFQKFVRYNPRMLVVFICTLVLSVSVFFFMSAVSSTSSGVSVVVFLKTDAENKVALVKSVAIFSHAMQSIEGSAVFTEMHFDVMSMHAFCVLKVLKISLGIFPPSIHTMQIAK